MAEFVDRSNYIDWNGSGMMEWAEGTPSGPGGHFLEKGHSRVAKKVFTHLKDRGIA